MADADADADAEILRAICPNPVERAKGCCRLGNVFVVVYDVASNFLQLIACNSSNNNRSRHFRAVVTPLCTFRFRLFMFASTLI